MKLDDLISQEYREVLINTHAANPTWGSSGKSHSDFIAQLAHAANAKNGLDYGCGTGTLKRSLWPESDFWSEFDPGIPGKDAMPEPAEFVVCTDVLEHIEPEKIDNVLQHLCDLTLKQAYLLIATSPSKVSLTDGRNSHLIVQNYKWWFRKLQKYKWHVSGVNRSKGLHVVCTKGQYQWDAT